MIFAQKAIEHIRSQMIKPFDAALQAQPGRPAYPGGPCKEAIVFMVGGGNYLEAESLAAWAGRAQPPKNVVYGATELLTGEQFARQLAELGKRSS
jgi:hypothetical protein